MTRLYSLKACALIALLLTPQTGFAQQAAGVTIAPTRVEFADNEKKSKLVVRNPSGEKQNYRVEMIDLLMGKDGSFEEVELLPEGSASAKPYIRFSPRSFSLDPQTSQTVRIQLRTPRELEDGEYRAHMRVRAVPDAKPPKVELGEDDLSINVKINYGVTIPVIFRRGELGYTLEVTESRIVTEKDHHFIKASVTREGLRSAYGDMRVKQVIGGDEEIVSFLPGTAMYLPLTQRDYTLPLDKEKTDLSKGSFVIEYIDRESGEVVTTHTVKR